MTTRKEVCPICKKRKRTCRWSYNKKAKRKICNTCNKKLGTNMLYIPKDKRKKVIGKYTMTELEKERLHKKFTSQGLDSIEAWNRVHRHVRMLRQVKFRQRGLKKIVELRKQRQEKEAKELRRRFLEGLK